MTTEPNASPPTPPQRAAVPADDAGDPALRGRFRTFASLRIPTYRRYFGAMFLYLGAMQMTVLARPWLAFDLSADDAGQRSALVLGLTVATNTAPSLFLSPWAGALADRDSKRNILIVAGVLMALFALGTAAGLATDVFEWWHVTLLGIPQGVVMTFITPARRAIIAELVDREHLLNAVALHTVQQNINRTMMPAIAGIVIALAGAGWAYVLISAFYGISVAALLQVPLTGQGDRARSPRSMSGSVGDGFRYAVQTPVIRTLLLIGLVGSIFGQPIQHLFPLFQDVLGIGPGRLGVLFTFFGIGSLMGSTTAASIGDFKRKGLLLVASFIMLGVSIIAFAASSYYLLSLIILIPVGMGHSGRVAVHVAMLQTYTEPAMRGRIMAINAMQGGIMPFSVLGITALSDTLNPQIALGIPGVLILVYGLWELTFSRSLRHLE